MVDFLYDSCYTLKDLKESFLFHSRGRKAITNGPVGGQTYIPVLCPFVDLGIFSLCMNTSKDIRSNLELYNCFWRLHFPILARIKKDNNNSNAYDNHMLVTLKSLSSKVLQRYLRVTDKDNKKINKYSNVDKFYEINKEFFDDKLGGRPFSSSLRKIREASLYVHKWGI